MEGGRENKKVQKSTRKKLAQGQKENRELYECLVKPTHKMKARPQKNREVIKSIFYFLDSQKKLSSLSSATYLLHFLLLFTD